MKHGLITAGFCCLSILSLQFSAAAEMVVQPCFSPQGKCSAHILREIESAKRELLVAVYAFTSVDLAMALVQAKKRGVAVQVVVDREFDRTNENSKGRFLEEQKIPVRRLSGAAAKAGDKDPGLMHQKFAVIDRRIVFTGSYNWTRSAENLNDENLLMFRDAGPLAEEYRKSFLRLWERKP
ncbi:MAG TPA: phospholipase D family protein [Candidatus Binatia bacterium]|jgi:mitochondrial cardiolipin hydrolase|nr:phospholipase D family protein [Candidatus Binatia bacterium]